MMKITKIIEILCLNSQGKLKRLLVSMSAFELNDFKKLLDLRIETTFDLLFSFDDNKIFDNVIHMTANIFSSIENPLTNIMINNGFIKGILQRYKYKTTEEGKKMTKAQVAWLIANYIKVIKDISSELVR